MSATRHTHTSLRRMLLVLAVAAVAIATAAGVWFAGSGTALAPEPARLNSTLNTASVSGVYIYSYASTKVVFMSSTSWTYSTIPAGTPCANTWGLAAGTTVYGVVVASGNYRKCN